MLQSLLDEKTEVFPRPSNMRPFGARIFIWEEGRWKIVELAAYAPLSEGVDELQLIEQKAIEWRRQVQNGGPLFLCIPSMNANGFDIEATFYDDSVHANFGGLEQEFESISGAMHWVRRALSSDYRLRIEMHGNRPYEWFLEPTHPNTYHAHDSLAFGVNGIFSRFQRRTMCHLQNHAVPG